MRVQINRILCATDFSDFSNRTISFGMALAREFRATLFICHVVELPFAGMYGEVQLDPIAQQERMIAYAHENLSRLVNDQDVEWEPLVAIGHPADEIARLVTQVNADLAISATHGRSGLKRLIIGSVTERLMRTLPCPLLIVRDQAISLSQQVGAGFHPKKILVGCDFSRDSDLAFQYGISLAQEFEAELHLVHVIEPPIYPDLQNAGDAQGAEHSRIAPLLERKMMGMVPEDARHWCFPVTVLMEGKPAEEISRYAEEKGMDLIVLGVRGQDLVESLFVGSTTDRVARQAPCPVLSVNPLI
ncbi:MAG: universal stress protein [Desulfobacterales bacterium]|jgi:nucleotide-binding universal stress UspA family protein|nr:universal stress protein [Desulfobacterales bacterium]